jgi:pyruvate formate lyase activating enzyme
MDAANVDLKSFSSDFYRRIVGGHLEVILDTLRYVVHETNCWVEITMLVIPGLNDSDSEIRVLCEWVASELGTYIPLHFTAFHPDNRLRETPRTPLSTLKRARRIALETGLNFVYLGNVTDPEGSTTFCPGCGQTLVERARYKVFTNNLIHGSCSRCDTVLPGRWDLP